ncbi:THOC5 protein [Schizosaccharomyces cryophilus OY26]|uniref:THOC5 protein n=1 Tax=Schizosaccharomyces cryophilus (strain OY26 / ATCC MYA-4695 / CBS 11777 / NBRC 106824 / NRRL Y48691) TaxID=653667 RepID=S9VTS9_SCHCR|nr:THOC5 protein [Schizosaccharomyces cryophilus OY26]EPY49470.1 THOC5 protein [Schizosaccharomyces cryophilus OY26]
MSENAVAECLETLESAKRLCLQIHSNKNEDPVNGQQRAHEIKKQLSARLLLLRAVNRESYEQLQRAKGATSEHRAALEQALVNLQALQYQKLHLNAIIKDYHGKEHLYTQLPLMSKEEFLKDHSELQNATDHEVMIARLQDELKERQRLSGLKQDLLKRKATLISENKAKRIKLEKLDDKLEAFFRSVIPVQEYYRSTSL